MIGKARLYEQYQIDIEKGINILNILTVRTTGNRSDADQIIGRDLTVRKGTMTRSVFL